MTAACVRHLPEGPATMMWL